MCRIPGGGDWVVEEAVVDYSPTVAGSSLDMCCNANPGAYSIPIWCDVLVTTVHHKHVIVFFI